MVEEHNIAYIDGQNLHLGTKQNDWKIDLQKFRRYLHEKYHIKEAYYHLGYNNQDNENLYQNLQKAGFIVQFREHNTNLIGKKKGNVDSDVVFEIMKMLIERQDFTKILLVSGDGDFKRLVDYLITKKRLKKILFPNRKFASSLYKKLGSEYFDYLDSDGIQAKIHYT